MVVEKWTINTNDTDRSIKEGNLWAEVEKDSHNLDNSNDKKGRRKAIRYQSLARINTIFFIVTTGLLQSLDTT